MPKYPIEHKVNASIIEYCNSLEGKEIANGNVIAKKLSSLVAIGLLSEQQKKIYDCLTEKPKDTNVISKEIKLPSLTVSTQLRRINSMTQLISFKVEGKNKLWYK